jgi:restriction system protein
LTLALIDLQGFLTTFVRLGIVVLLLLIAIVFARVLIELRIEQRRKEMLAATRNICSLTPSEFEEYVGVLFEKAGYRVKRTGGSGDRGIDLIVSRNGKASVVQCKRYEDDVGPSAVRELIGAMTNSRATRGFLVTTSGFTVGASQEAGKAPYEIRLLDGRGVVRWARQYGLPGEVMDQG